MVTGGASGLGAATVIKFIELGAKVIACDLPTSITNNSKQIQQQLINNNNNNNKNINIDEQLLFAPVDVSCYYNK